VLISGEQFGLGGLGSVRGTDVERPISADKGLAATLEVTTPEIASGLRLLGFVDAGYLRNNHPDGFNKPGSDRLASIGVGLRYAVGPLVASLDYGHIVRGSRVPLSLNSNSPQRGDGRFYVIVSARF
jgi:hemolysin activation/secretion protein